MRVAIVNDVLLVIEVLKRIVTSDPEHQIAWTALDGSSAVRQAGQDPPDVILMDLLMPVMNGADATREIMRRAPCPILVVTQTVAGNYPLVCQALGYGAYDAVNTPTLGGQSPRVAGADLLGKLSRVERISRSLSSSGRFQQRAASTGETAALPSVVSDTSATVFETPALQTGIPQRPIVDRVTPLVVMGASTGGPPALEAILTTFAATFHGAVLVVQHIDRDFTPALVNWLAERCRLPVRSAAQGDRPTPGTVLVAATNDHLVMQADRTLTYSREPADCPYRPSVDALFDSLVQHWPQPGVAVLLTGIGRDGAEGLLKLRQKGWMTIAQDQSTSVVYGMPKAAVQLDAARRCLPLPEIASHILSSLKRP